MTTRLSRKNRQHFHTVRCPDCGHVYRKRKATATPCPTPHRHKTQN